MRINSKSVYGSPIRYRESQRKRAQGRQFTVHSSLRGQTLVEVIISVAVAVVLSVSLVAVTLMTQRASRSARNNTQASKLAQENIEQIRVFRDRNGFSALPTIDTTNPTSECYVLNASGSPSSWSFGSKRTSCTSNTTTMITCTGSLCQESIPFSGITFYRKILMTTPLPPPNKKLFTVSVNWIESGVLKTASEQTYLSDWEGTQ